MKSPAIHREPAVYFLPNIFAEAVNPGSSGGVRWEDRALGGFGDPLLGTKEMVAAISYLFF